jgi:rod shape-determining protein MreD
MKIFSIYFLVAIFALSIQSVFFTGVKPDSTLILVFFYSLRYGQTKGVLFGALSGLLVDISSGFIIGPHMMSKVFAGYFSASIRQKMFWWNIIINTLMVVILSFIDILLIYICLETFADVSFANRAIVSPIKQVIFTTAISIVVYPILSPEKDENSLIRARAGA